jgi:sialidase-1
MDRTLLHPTRHFPTRFVWLASLKHRKCKGTKKEVLFFSNANSSTSREAITIKASLDLGATWLPANQLLIDERKTFGYSVLTKIDDNTIGLL